MQYNKHKLRNLSVDEQEIAFQIKKFEKNYLDLYNVVNLEFKYIFTLLLLQFTINCYCVL